MRRKAADEGISPKTFDKVANTSGYAAAKSVAITARTDLDAARYDALVESGIVPRGRAGGVPANDLEWADLYDDYDIPDDFDWWYH